jgi:hypothetical protein
MDKHEQESQPFNERAALEELERFKNDIERYRPQRKAVGEEFDHFVQSFKGPSDQPPAVTAAAARPAPPPQVEAPRVQVPRVAPPVGVVPASAPVQAAPAAPPTAAASESIRPAGDSGTDPRGRATPRVEPKPAAAKAVVSERMTAERAHGKSGRPSPVVILALVLLAAGVAAWFFWPHQLDDATTVPTSTTAAPTQQTPAAAPAEAPAVPPATAAPSNETVVTTLGPVWLRVIADGVKVREDEFPAGTRIPVDVRQTLVIRTGNAGAVSLTLKGKDQGPLGAEGQVVTRTFTVPQR